MPGGVGGKGMGKLGIDWAITLTHTCMLAIKASKKKKSENKKRQKIKKLKGKEKFCYFLLYATLRAEALRSS